METIEVVIGIDGGATKTEASIVECSTRQVLGVGHAGSSNKNSVGNDVAKQNLASAMANALANAIKNSTSGQKLYKLGGICFGMSGVDRPHDKELVRSWVSDIVDQLSRSNTVDDYQPLSAKEQLTVEIYNDAIGAMASGTLGKLKDSLVIISGTGMIVTGSDDGKTFVRTGGWGPLLGDEGSGYAIGSSILRAVVNAEDGIGEETLLVQLVKKSIGIVNTSELIDFVYKDTAWSRVADLARLAFEGYKKDDAVSRRIVHDAVNNLAKYIEACVRKLGWNFDEKHFTLVYTGSILCHEDSVVAKLLSEMLRQTFKNITITVPTVSASVGAALLLVQ